LLALTLAFGFAARAIVQAVDGSWVAGTPAGSGSLGTGLAHWVFAPCHLASWVGPVTYISLAAAILGVSLRAAGPGWSR